MSSRSEWDLAACPLDKAAKAEKFSGRDTQLYGAEVKDTKRETTSCTMQNKDASDRPVVGATEITFLFNFVSTAAYTGHPKPPCVGLKMDMSLLSTLHSEETHK